METCDICAEPLDGNGQVVANDRVRFVVAALGVYYKTLGEFAESFGMPRQQLAMAWFIRKGNTGMPWHLCPTCALHIERLAYAAENVIKEKQSKKAWQFWK